MDKNETQAIRELIALASQHAVNLDKLIDTLREELRGRRAGAHPVGVAADGNQVTDNCLPVARVGNV